MTKSYLCLIITVLLAGSGLATNVPFTFDGKSLDLTGYDLTQSEASALTQDTRENTTKDTIGDAPASLQINYEMIETSLSPSESINEPYGDSSNLESEGPLSGFFALNESPALNSTSIFFELPDVELPPYYAIKVSPAHTTADQWFEKGNKNYTDGRYSDAIGCYDQAIKLNPQLKEIWCNKGIALCRLGKYPEAIDAIDHAIAISPNYPKAWRSKGDALKAMGKDDDARKAYQKAGQ